MFNTASTREKSSSILSMSVNLHRMSPESTLKATFTKMMPRWFLHMLLAPFLKIGMTAILRSKQYAGYWSDWWSDFDHLLWIEMGRAHRVLEPFHVSASSIRVVFLIRWFLCIDAPFSFRCSQNRCFHSSFIDVFFKMVSPAFQLSFQSRSLTQLSRLLSH